MSEIRTSHAGNLREQVRALLKVRLGDACIDESLGGKNLRLIGTRSKELQPILRVRAAIEETPRALSPGSPSSVSLETRVPP